MTKCCSIFKRGILEATAEKPTRVGCVNCKNEETAEPLIGYATRIPTKDVSARSSNIAAVGYDAGPKLLRVDFKNGTRYVFVDVPEHTAVGLTSATDGYGTIFAATIRGKFRSMKLEPPRAPCGAWRRTMTSEALPIREDEDFPIPNFLLRSIGPRPAMFDRMEERHRARMIHRAAWLVFCGTMILIFGAPLFAHAVN